MKIAVAADNDRVTEHFGHGETFWIFETEENRILSKKAVQNPGHRPGFLPNFLKEQGANVIIAGGMGQRATELFQENGIDVIVGASGDVEKAVKGYLEGTLISTESVCHEHRHHGNCGS